MPKNWNEFPSHDILKTIQQEAELSQREYEQALKRIESFFNLFNKPSVRSSLLSLIGKNERTADTSNHVQYHSQKISADKVGLPVKLPDLFHEFWVDIWSKRTSSRDKNHQLFSRILLLPEHVSAMGVDRFLSRNQWGSVGIIPYNEVQIGKFHFPQAMPGSIHENQLRLLDNETRERVKKMKKIQIVQEFAPVIPLYNFGLFALADEFIQFFTPNDLSQIEEGLLKTISSKKNSWF